MEPGSRFVVFANLDFATVDEPGYGKRAAAQLERDVRNGAQGLKIFKNLGISISLDDFGTGYASLSQLHTLPVDRIKIDRGFINTMVKSERTAAIVNTIASLGHKLNVPITAEGVETESIRGELSKLGCTEAQGWLFGRAVSADTVNSFLQMGGGQKGEPHRDESSGDAAGKTADDQRRSGSAG